MRDEVLLKHFGMGYMYVKMHGFHDNPLYDSREWGIVLQIQSYLGFLQIRWFTNLTTRDMCLSFNLTPILVLYDK